METLDVDDVRMALKELVIGLNNSSEDRSNPEDIRKCLLNLEENDEHFHRYSLIKMIRAGVEGMLGPLVDVEMSQLGGTEDGSDGGIGPHLNVDELSNRISSSSAYSTFVSRLSSTVENAAQDLRQNFDAELLPCLLATSDHVDSADISALGRNYSCLKTLGGGSKKTEILYSACDSPMDDSSSSQDTAMFLTNDSLAEIATNLNKKNSTEKRQSALRSLLINTSVLDLPHAVWPPIREELLDILLNFDGPLWVQTLKIIARGLNGTSLACAKEMFQLLVEVLVAQFDDDSCHDHDNDEEGGRDNDEEGSHDNDGYNNDAKDIDLRHSHVDKLLRAFRLVAQYIQQLSTKPAEKNTPDSFKGLILLLSKSRPCSVGLTPFQLLSLVDPKAAWFTRAMHGNHTRNLMLQLIGEDKHLLSHCLQLCSEYSSSVREYPRDINSSPAEYRTTPSSTRQRIEWQSVMVSIVIVTGVISFTNGRSLFPLGRGSKTEKSATAVHLQEAVVVLINILLSSDCCCCRRRHHHREPSSSSSTPEPNPNPKARTMSATEPIHPLSFFSPSLASPCGATLVRPPPCPCSVAMETVEKLSRTEEASRLCLCHGEIVSVLLKPLSDWLIEEKKFEANHLTRILRSCKVIDTLTFAESGRRFLISRSVEANGDESGDKHQSPIKVLTDFICELLTLEPDVKEPGFKVTVRSILGHLLRVTKALSSSCRGIQVLSRHGYHSAIKSAHAVTSREIENLATPTPGSLEIRGGDPNLSTNEKASLMEWEATLKDSLLSLLTTPKGLGLVSGSGLLSECLAHMCIKCDRKLQRNDLNEKFSYWFVTSQISTIPSGMFALSDAGFISILVTSLWSALETSSDIEPPTVDPPSDRTDPCQVQTPTRPLSPCCVEKFSSKPFDSLANVLCSFGSFSRLMADEDLPSRTLGSRGESMPPQSIMGLLDRLSLVHTDAKIRSLYSFEQSHLCGLRLLNLLTCCLDTYLLLQSQYDITKILVLCQRENVAHENSKEIIIDSLSLMRNHILVRCYLIGGPGERLLPLKDLDSHVPKHPIRFFWDYPVPECYLLRGSRKTGPDTLPTALNAKNPNGWSDFRRSVLEILSRNPCGIKDDVAMTMLEHSLEYWLAKRGETPGSDIINVPSSAAKRFSYSKVQLEGMNMVTRYGKHLKLWNVSGKESIERLKTVIAKVTLALRKKFRPEGKGNPANGSEPNGSGFDWFSSSIFLLTGGNANRTTRFLTRLSFLPLSASFWAQFVQFMTLSANQTTTDQNMVTMICATNHNFEVLLQNELPQVYSAFKLSGLAPGQVFQHWCRQCFLNYLDWPQIQQYLVTCLCLGPDYPTYFCLALLRHLEVQIKHQMKERNLTIFLREEPIRNFHLDQHLPFMQALEERYRPTVMGDLVESLSQLKR